MSAADQRSLLRKSELESEYKVEVKHNIDRLGEVLVLKNHEGHRIMAKEKRPTTIEDCKRDVNQAIERMKLNHNHLLKMHDYSVMLEDGQFVIRGYYELADANLAIELEQRKEAKANFSAEELRNLLVDILEIVTFLKEKKMIHGDIRPEYVMYDADTQIYKLADRLGDPSPPTKVQAKNIVRGRKLYLSPQIFFNLVHQTRGTPDFESVKLNPYLSEGYAIGLLLLESSLLEDVQSIYDFDYGHINEASLAEKIDRFINMYEEQDIGLVRAVQDLLETSEEERPDLHLLLTGLKSTPQNSMEEDDLGDLQYATEGDFHRDIIQEVEEEDDLSTQNHLVKSSHRQNKESIGNRSYKNDSYPPSGSNPVFKSPEGVQLTQVSAKEISDFPEVSGKNNELKEDFHGDHSLGEETAIETGKSGIPPKKTISQKQSEDDLLFPKRSLQQGSVHGQSLNESVAHQKLSQDSKATAVEKQYKESKGDSKNETTKHSVSLDQLEDEAALEREQSLENNIKMEFLKKKEGTFLKEELKSSSQQSSHYALHEKTSYQSARDETSSPSREKKEPEEVDWEKNLADIKRQREEVLQGLQSLKLLQQDNHKHSEAMDPRKDKSSSNIFKEEFASGQSLHYMVPNQLVNTKSSHNSGDQKAVASKESDQLQLTSKQSSNRDRPVQSETVESRPDSQETQHKIIDLTNDYKNARFNYKDDRYGYHNYGYMTDYDQRIERQLEEEGNGQRREDKVERSFENDTAQRNWKVENMPSLPKDLGEITPGKVQQKHSTYTDSQNPAAYQNSHQTVTEVEKTPQQITNKRKFEESTQFRAYEETPIANYAKAQENRVLIEEPKKTTPFTALRPGDVLINSSQKVRPQHQYESKQYVSEIKTDLSSVRELPPGSMLTSNKDLSSFNVTSQFDASEKRSPSYIYKKSSDSPIPKKYEPLVQTEKLLNYHHSNGQGYLTPSSSQQNLFNYDEGEKQMRVTPSQQQFRFKPTQESTPVRQVRPQQGYSTMQRDASPVPQGVAVSTGPLNMYQSGSSYNKMIVTSHIKPEDLKPIVIRSRSTTPIKNSLAGLNSVSESIAQIVNTHNSQGQMKSSQGMSTAYTHNMQPARYETTKAAANLDSIFQTGSNAPAYRGFESSKAQEYYEIASPIIKPNNQNMMASSNNYSTGCQGYPVYQSSSQNQWASRADHSPAMTKSTFVPQINHQVATFTPNRSVSPVPADSNRRNNLQGSYQTDSFNHVHQSAYIPQGTFNTNSHYQTNTVHNSVHIPSTGTNYFAHGHHTPQRSTTPTRATQQQSYGYLARTPSSSSFVASGQQAGLGNQQWQTSSQFNNHY